MTDDKIVDYLTFSEKPEWNEDTKPNEIQDLLVEYIFKKDCSKLVRGEKCNDGGENKYGYEIISPLTIEIQQTGELKKFMKPREELFSLVPDQVKIGNIEV